MSDSKPKRTIPEIQAQYQELCMRVGHLKYQVFTHEKDLQMLCDELRDLNLEAAAVKAAEAEAAKKAAEEVASAPKLEVVSEESKEV